MHYIYILYLKSNKLYTGFTSDLKKRMIDHNNNKVRSTRHLQPKLIHTEVYLRESDARRREKFLKTTEGKRLLRMQLRDILQEIGYLKIEE